MLGGVVARAPMYGLARDPRRIVDMGCGTGVATVQIASMYPEAHVLGVDISPVPDAMRNLAPGNVSWIQNDILDADMDRLVADAFERSSPTGLNSLDFVFGRMLYLAINDWPRYFSTGASLLRAGGFIEHQDVDFDFYRAGTNERLSGEWGWHRAVAAGLRRAGLSASAGSSAASYMRDAGFEVVDVHTFKFPFIPSANAPNSHATGYVQSKLIPLFLRKMLQSQDISEDELQRFTNECLLNLVSEEGIHLKYTVTVGRKQSGT
jgi:SAM-dependent methyltransferase